ncbi:MAG: SPFH domain-containing protein, partial [Bacteroidota bacterium]
MLTNSISTLSASIFENAVFTIILGSLVAVFAVFFFIARLYRKAKQGEALVITGARGIRVAFSGTVIIPVFEKMEVMDITLKTIVIARTGGDGLVCQDNMRADIKVTFFIRVNQTIDDVKQVAQSIGCQRASHQESLVILFDAHVVLTDQPVAAGPGNYDGFECD